MPNIPCFYRRRTPRTPPDWPAYSPGAGPGFDRPDFPEWERPSFPEPTPRDHDKAGVALATLDLLPLNGLRHPPVAGTSGWYLWGGESLSEAPDFFAPLHHQHLPEYCHAALPFLALPPGWRFLVAPGYVDLWFDPGLLEVGER